MNLRWGLVLGASLLVACGGMESASDDGGGNGDGGGSDGSVSDAAIDAGGGDAAPRELDGGACPTSLTPFKGCTRAEECAIEGVGNCCGDGDYVGISGSAVADYRRCNPIPNCAGLGCATSSNCKAEDGNVASCAFDTKALGIACNNNLCETFIITDAGDGG